MGPTYRFWGSRRPDRHAPRNAADLAAVDGSVATIRLYDPIDSWGEEWGISAKEFARALDQLPDDVTETRLLINSPGGEVHEAITMLNALRDLPGRYVAEVQGIAASAASFLAAGADEVVMAENSQLMIHDAWGLAIGNAADLRGTADVLDKLSDNIASVYAARAPQTDWRAAMLAETWLDAHEAVEAGLADRVKTKAPAEEAATAARFDLSVFAHAGRDKAPVPVLLPLADTQAQAQQEQPPAAASRRHRDQVRHRMNRLKNAG